GRLLLAVVALQHLVDDDPEALVDGRLLGDAEDAGELVLERAGSVELDVRCRKRKALAASRQEGLERWLVALGDQLAPALGRALLVEQVRIETRVPQRGSLLRRDRLLEEV